MQEHTCGILATSSAGAGTARGSPKNVRKLKANYKFVVFINCVYIYVGIVWAFGWAEPPAVPIRPSCLAVAGAPDYDAQTRVPVTTDPPG